MSIENKNKSYVACVVGCGRAGFTYDLDINRKETYSHIGMYKKSDKISKVVAVDKDFKLLNSVKKKYSDVSCYNNLKNALSNEKIDIISVCTPTNIRYEIIDKAIKSGIKTIFCEKPIADNLFEAQKIIALCRQNNVKLAVNYFRRWDDFHVNIAKFIKSEKLGKIKSIIFRYSNGIINTGSHAFDLIQMIFGKIISVESTLNLNDSKIDPTLNVTAELENKNKVYFYGYNKEDFRIFELDIIGELGRIVIHNGYEMEYYRPEKSIRNSEFKVLSKKDPIFKNGRNFHYENALFNIINFIEYGEKILCDENDAMSSLRCSLAAIDSYTKGKKVVF